MKKVINTIMWILLGAAYAGLGLMMVIAVAAIS